MKHTKKALVGALLLSFFIGCDSEEFVSAKMWLQNGELVKAEEFFLQALEVEPTNGEIPLTLASQIYLPAERWDEMNRMLDEAIKRGPESVTPNGLTVASQVNNLREVAWSQQYQKGANLYNEVLQATDGETPDEAQTASLLQAVEHFMTAVQIDPNDERTYQPLVFCYRQMRDVDGERKAIKTALEANPDNGIILALAGENARNESRFEDAVGFLEKASGLLPDDLNILTMLTGIYIDLDDSQSALETLEKSAKRAPRDANVFYNIGAVYTNIANAALIKGQDIYIAQGKLETADQTQIEIALKSFKAAQESYSEALYYMDNVLAIDPDDTAADQSIRDITSRKKRLGTLERAAEGLQK